MSLILNETKKVFKEYLKTVAAESKSKFDEVQALIYCTPDVVPVFAGSGKDGTIKTEAGKVRRFSVRELIGRTLQSTYGMMRIKIDEEVAKILQKVLSDHPDIPPVEMCITAVALDFLYSEIQLSLYHKTTFVKQLSWNYVLDIKDE